MAKILIGATVEELAEEIDGFFMRTDKVWKTMDRVTARLRDEGIPYAILGGMSLALHGYVRVTADVDVLTTRDGLVGTVVILHVIRAQPLGAVVDVYVAIGDGEFALALLRAAGR